MSDHWRGSACVFYGVLNGVRNEKVFGLFAVGRRLRMLAEVNVRAELAEQRLLGFCPVVGPDGQHLDHHEYFGRTIIVEHSGLDMDTAKTITK